MKSYHKAIVRKSESKNENLKSFFLEFELDNGVNFQFKPGQFVVLEPLNKRSVMPRPFSIVDAVGNTITLLMNAVGENTKAYSLLKKGDRLIVNGPQGRPIEVDSNAKSYILVAGGIGGAALVAFARYLRDMGIKFIVLLGAKYQSEFSGLKYFEKYTSNILSISEFGGEKSGFVTDLLDGVLAVDKGISNIVACGPDRMLNEVHKMSKRYKNTCQVMLEEIMACGMGSCKGCAITGIDKSVKHVCEDGPIFDADWIDWEKFIPYQEIKIFKNHSIPNDAMHFELDELVLEYPTMNSSGCLSIGALEEERFDFSKLGALVTKGVTVQEKYGNIMPRTCETPAGMINSIGLENIGIDKFRKDELPRWLALGKPVYVNISGFKLDHYLELVSKLDDTDIAGYEVNISCPNVNKGIAFGVDPELARSTTHAVRYLTEKTVIVKLTPNVTDIVEIAKAVESAGADAISLINTLQAMAIDPYSRLPKIGMKTGGLSGPAIRPIAVRMVYELYLAKLGIPIIGMGGIEDGFTAAEFFIAGADMVAAGTGGFANREIFTQIDEELRSLLYYHDFSSIKELTGSLKSR